MAIVLLTTGAALVGCGGGDNGSSPPPVAVAPPPAPVMPAAMDFNRYAATMATSTNRDADAPEEVGALTFGFNDDEAAFSTLFP